MTLESYSDNGYWRYDLSIWVRQLVGISWA